MMLAHTHAYVPNCRTTLTKTHNASENQTVDRRTHENNKSRIDGENEQWDEMLAA